MKTSYQRGHRIIFDVWQWVYADTKETISEERPCVRCKEMPTEEGDDVCLGHIDGVTEACCGHGVTEAFRK